MEQLWSDLQEIFRDVFDDETIVLQKSTCAADIEDWDSLAQMELLAAIEGHFHIHFQIHEVINLSNVGEMAGLISRKLPERG